MACPETAGKSVWWAEGAQKVCPEARPESKQHPGRDGPMGSGEEFRFIPGVTEY